MSRLSLQVLHLKKEVTKCIKFKSADESLTLVPEDQFFTEVMVTLHNNTASAPPGP